MERFWWLGFLGLFGLLGLTANPGFFGLFGLFALFALRGQRSSADGEAGLNGNARRQQSVLRFSLKALLVVVALVAAFMAGRSSLRTGWPLTSATSGTWTVTYTSGHKHPATLTDLKDGRVQYYSRNSSFNGAYRWRLGNFELADPSDKRMKGIVWSWDGTKFTLVAEPTNFPTGASYMGTTMERAK